MQYRKDKYGVPLSVLGFGCMRFTRKGNALDLEKAEKEIMAAYEAGVNYFDTAYIYPGSEVLLGTVLSRNGIREKVHIATKLPQYMISSLSGVEKYFKEELSRLRTDYVDYYLMHHLTDAAQWERLKHAGILRWIDEKKKSGAVRNIGFSYHGNTENFLKILADYDWDFCQIQYNYLDETAQAGRAGLQAAAARGIPVIIMEPLRGGKLVNALPKDALELIARETPGKKPAELAFRWLYDQPGVSCVLSGMNSLEMVEENCRWADEYKAGQLTGTDQAFYRRLAGLINAKMRVGCTGCGYCMPCPQGVDIPGTFRCWNHMYTEGRHAGRFEYFQTVSLQKKPPFASQCVGCGRCEKHCPQHIPIISQLKLADRELRPPYIRAANKAASAWLFRHRRGEQP